MCRPVLDISNQTSEEINESLSRAVEMGLGEVVPGSDFIWFMNVMPFPVPTYLGPEFRWLRSSWENQNGVRENAEN